MIFNSIQHTDICRVYCVGRQNSRKLLVEISAIKAKANFISTEICNQISTVKKWLKLIMGFLLKFLRLNRQR
jgi:hypothetical protein